MRTLSSPWTYPRDPTISSPGDWASKSSWFECLLATSVCSNASRTTRLWAKHWPRYSEPSLPWTSGPHCGVSLCWESSPVFKLTLHLSTKEFCHDCVAQSHRRTRGTGAPARSFPLAAAAGHTFLRRLAVLEVGLAQSILLERHPRSVPDRIPRT